MRKLITLFVAAASVAPLFIQAQEVSSNGKTQLQTEMSSRAAVSQTAAVETIPDGQTVISDSAY